MKFKKVIKALNENLTLDQEDELIDEAKATINNLEEYLDHAISCCNNIERIFDELGIHSADIKPYLTNYLDDFINGGFESKPSVEEFKERLSEYSSYEYEEDEEN